MSWVLFAVGVGFATLTFHAHRPLRWPGTFVLGAWSSTWLIIELALHVFALQVVTGVVLASLGGLHNWYGFVGLGLCGAAAIGQLRHDRLARHTASRLSGALEEALGSDYHEGVAAQTGGSPPPWLQKLRILPLRHRSVRCVRNITYHGVGRRRLELDIYHHESRPSRRPVLLYVHGGGWIIGNKSQQGLLTVNHMAARGWVCASINYRLSPHATFPDHLLDVKRAIRWVREHIEEYGGDPSFVIIAGGSAGAHLASLCALTPNVTEYQRDFADVDTSVQGCVGYYGVYDFTNAHGHWRHRSFQMLLERVIMKRRYHDAPEEYRKASPLYRATEAAPPFLLIHGDRDNLAPVGEARRFCEALKLKSSAPVAYAELPGAQHAFELFPSTRSLQAVDGVGRFCEHIYRAHKQPQQDRAIS